jgi:tRNA threonylcarbamoyladenosine biosynthesis protein TsaB
MLILAVDTSGRQSSVALLRNEGVLAATGGFSDEPYASRLFNDVGLVLGQARVELAQIEVFAAGTGPGSFTGLRVGLSAVKGWAEAFGRQIVPVSGLEAVAVQAGTTDRPVCPVIDARGGKLYGAVFERVNSGAAARLELKGDEVVLGTEEFFPWISRQVDGKIPVFVTPTRQVMEAALATSPMAGAAIEEVSGELAPFIGRLGYARAREGRSVDPAGLEANYIRRSDAEMNWRSG